MTIADEGLRLFDSTPELEARVRSTDPDTSWRAARISPELNEKLKDTVFRILANGGPMTDDELFAAYVEDGGTRTAQRVRTARAEMTRTRDIRTKFLVPARIRVAGIGQSAHGGQSQKWEVVR